MLRFTFFYPLTYEHVGKIQKKEKKTNIYTSQTHTQLHTDKKERKKNTPQYLLLYCSSCIANCIHRVSDY